MGSAERSVIVYLAAPALAVAETEHATAERLKLPRFAVVVVATVYSGVWNRDLAVLAAFCILADTRATYANRISDPGFRKVHPERANLDTSAKTTPHLPTISSSLADTNEFNITYRRRAHIPESDLSGCGTIAGASGGLRA